MQQIAFNQYPFEKKLMSEGPWEKSGMALVAIWAWFALTLLMNQYRNSL